MKFLIATSVALVCGMSATPAIAGYWGWKPYIPNPAQCIRMYKYFNNFHSPAAFATPNGVPANQANRCGQSEKPGANEANDALIYCNNASHSHSCKVIGQHS